VPERATGLGRVYEVTERAMVPDDSLSIRERAIASWPPAWHGQNLRDILVSLGIDVDVPWRELPKKTRDWILFTDEQPTVPVYPGFTPPRRDRAASQDRTRIHGHVHRRAPLRAAHVRDDREPADEAARRALHDRGDLPGLRRQTAEARGAGGDVRGPRHRDALAPAARPRRRGARAGGGGTLRRRRRSGERDPQSRSDAQGAALRPRGAQAAIAERVAAGGSAHAGAFDVRRTPDLSAEKRIAAQRIAAGVVARIETLRALGLGYLSLDRGTPTLSSGELQRLRLATQIRSNLFGVVYVLDEPTAGLHPRTAPPCSARSTRSSVRELGLHRRARPRNDAPRGLDRRRRPDAGERGGRVLYSGPPAGLADVGASHTARYLFDRAPLPERRPRGPHSWLVLRGITRNNLVDLDVRFPLGVLTAVTGVSGAGKSSLVGSALVDLVCRHLGHEPDDDEDDADTGEGPTLAAETHGRIDSGMDRIARLVRVDQKPIGRTPRSNLATYTPLRRRPQALRGDAGGAARTLRRRALLVQRRQGRCETCEGEGFVCVELLFMPSVYGAVPRRATARATTRRRSR
jgi:excinuclease ABC subunit A